MVRMRGFTMLELLIAMGLGMLISAAALQLFLANQVTLNFQRGMDDVQASGRFALDQMAQELRVAGLAPISSTVSVLPPIVFAATDITTSTSVPVVTGNDLGTVGTVGNANAAGAGVLQTSDQLVIQRYVDSDTVDCEGNTVTAGNYLISRYFVRPDDTNGNIPALVCDAAKVDGATTVMTGYNDGGAVLVDGVDSFQVLYGIDDGVNSNAQVARYVDAATYNALATKPPVLAVRIGVYMQSSERAGNAVQAGANVQVLDRSINYTTIPNDSLMRRLFITTVGLRNAAMNGV